MEKGRYLAGKRKADKDKLGAKEEYNSGKLKSGVSYTADKKQIKYKEKYSHPRIMGRGQ